MSADRGVRAARWRRWLASLPVVAALLLAAPAPAGSTGPVEPQPVAAPLAVLATVAEPALGQRPDLPVLVGRGAPGTLGTDTAAAWLPARGMVLPSGRSALRRDVVAAPPTAARGTVRQRGPPGRA